MANTYRALLSDRLTVREALAVELATGRSLRLGEWIAPEFLAKALGLLNPMETS